MERNALRPLLAEQPSGYRSQFSGYRSFDVTLWPKFHRNAVGNQKLMSERRVDAFFYGLFMDVAVLRDSGVTPIEPRRAYVDDFAVRIGQRATLVPSVGGRAYGMLIALTQSELERLYAAPGLDLYSPEAVLAHPLTGEPSPALCYNLREPPRAEERNADYAARLQRVLRSLEFPWEYIDSIG